MKTAIQVMPWVLSATSIYSTLIQGNKDRRGWMMGFVNCVLWIIYTIITAQWGLIPLNVVMSAVHIRNYLKK